MCARLTDFGKLCWILIILWACVIAYAAYNLAEAGEVYIVNRVDGADIFDSNGTITHIYKGPGGTRIISEDADVPKVEVWENSDGTTGYSYDNSAQEFIWSDE